MLIKCPQCAINYNVPDDKLGGAPRKMRCNRCKHVFAVIRRSESPPPAGYEEFTGTGHSLPPEFAFLREATSLPPQPIAPEPEEPRATSPTPMAVTSNETTYKGPPPPPPAAKAVATASAAVSVSSQSTSHGRERDDDTTLPVNYRSRERAYTWENQDPLELDSFAVGLENPRTRLIGMIVSGVLVAMILFFVFVAYRNGWSLSLDNLPRSMGYALSGRPTDSLPSSVNGLEVTVESARTIKRDGASPVLVVEGSVFNNTAVDRSGVVLRLRVFNEDDDIETQALAPCGRFLKESEISALAAGKASGSTGSGCNISADSTAVYQFVIEQFPAGFDPIDDIEVKAVEAAIR